MRKLQRTGISQCEHAGCISQARCCAHLQLLEQPPSQLACQMSQAGACGARDTLFPAGLSQKCCILRGGSALREFNHHTSVTSWQRSPSNVTRPGMIVPKAEVSVRSKGRTRGIVWGGLRQGKRDVGGIGVPDQKDAAVEHLQLLVQQAGCQIRGARHPAYHAGKHAGAPMAVGTILLCSTRCLHSRQCGAGLPLSKAQLPDHSAQGV